MSINLVGANITGDLTATVNVTGTTTIGALKVGDLLHAHPILNDPDAQGLLVMDYYWYLDGVLAHTGLDFSLTAAMVGKAVSFHISGNDTNPSGSLSMAGEWEHWAAQVGSVMASNTAPTAMDDLVNVDLSLGHSVMGNVLANDDDANGDALDVVAISGSAVYVSAPLYAMYGTLQNLGANGAYTYSANLLNPSVIALASYSDTLTDTFSYKISDGNGGTDMATLKITIHGVNDAAVMAGTDSGTVTQEGVEQAFGHITVTDVDNGDLDALVTANGTSDKGLGHFYVNATGDWSFTLDATAADYLGALQFTTDTFQVTADDGTHKTITISVYGANDDPTAQHASGSINEAVVATVSNSTTGMLDFGDVDGNDSPHVVELEGLTSTRGSFSATGDLGTIIVSAGGAWVYQLDDASLLVDSMNVGDTATDTFTYKVADNHGGTATETITVTIHGQNDAATFSGDFTGWITEDAAARDAGAFYIDDVDNTDDAVSDSGTALYGHYVVWNSGSVFWSYTADMSSLAIQALNTGDILTDTFSVEAVDGTLKTVTVTIHGLNDAADITGDFQLTGTEAGGASNSNSGSGVLFGHLTVSDVDNTSNLLQSDSGSGDNGYGFFNITASGDWTYTLDNSNTGVEGLQAGETLTDGFTVRAADGTTQHISVVINGANDNPVASDDAASATEAGTAAGANGTGNVLTNDTDVDANDTKTVTEVNGSGANVGAGLAGTYGTLTLNANGTYSYAVNNANATVNALRLATDTLTDTFTYKVADSQGGTDTATLTVTIHGANDAVVAVDDTGSATEMGSGSGGGGAGANATGDVLANDTDVDASDTKTVSKVNGSAANVGAGIASSNGYGTLTLNANGTYTYVVNDANATVDHLASGATLHDHFSYTVVDAAGAADIATLDITINGANDAPVAGVNSATAIESGTAPGQDATGNVLGDDTDVDNGHVLNVDNFALSVSNVSVTVAGSYGDLHITISGAFDYVVNETLADSLAESDIAHETFSYVVSDGLGGYDTASLVIWIEGANDAPVAGDDTNAAYEAGATQSASNAAGNLIGNDTDVDHLTNLHAQPTTIDGDFGTIYINASGAYSYILDQTLADSLDAGATATDSFSYTVTDAYGATDIGHITITVHGANDAPVAASDTGTATEDGTSGGFSAIGDVMTNDHDVDANDSIRVVSVMGHDFTQTYTITSGVSSSTAYTYYTTTTMAIDVAGAYGTLHITQHGAYTYDLDDVNVTVDALADGSQLFEDFAYDIYDTHGQHSGAVLHIVIEGANDAPVASNDTGLAGEAGSVDSGADAAGNVLTNDTDVDTGDTRTVYAIEGQHAGVGHSVAGEYGTITLNADGTYTYVVDQANAAVNEMGPTDELHDTFQYTIRDADGAESTATLDITIAGQNDAPTGTVTISGAPYAGQELFVNFSLSDPEGFDSPFHYEWQADGVMVGTDAPTYVLTDADAGKVITVIVSYTDGGGTVESMTGTVTTIPGLDVKGSQRSDKLFGSTGDDNIDGGNGRDVMTGGEGNDLYHVNDAGDKIVENAGEGLDSVISSASYVLSANVENLTLTGTATNGKGNDLANVIVGNDAKNVISGLGGADTMTGGLGADTFVFNSGDHDVITDFSAAQKDKINLKAIDANESRVGDQAFKFIGGADFVFADNTGLLRYDAALHLLLGSTDADADAEVVIELVGVNELLAANLVL